MLRHIALQDGVGIKFKCHVVLRLSGISVMSEIDLRLSCNARLKLLAQCRNCRYAARWVVMSRDSSRSVVPREIRERISRSRETDGSPASILATRDWLD
jgi:hypothetical protein